MHTELESEFPTCQDISLWQCKHVKSGPAVSTLANDWACSFALGPFPHLCPPHICHVVNDPLQACPVFTILLLPCIIIIIGNANGRLKGEPWKWGYVRYIIDRAYTPVVRFVLSVHTAFIIRWNPLFTGNIKPCIRFRSLWGQAWVSSVCLTV